MHCNTWIIPEVLNPRKKKKLPISDDMNILIPDIHICSDGHHRRLAIHQVFQDESVQIPVPTQFNFKGSITRPIHITSEAPAFVGGWWADAIKNGDENRNPNPTLADFKTEVLAEIEVLKLKLKPEDLDKLNFNKFDHRCKTWCLLGLLTRNSFSEESKMLLPKKYVNISKFHHKLLSPQRRYKYISFENQEMHNGSNYCAIEKYFYMSYRPTHKKIFAYLKGETSTLKL